MPQRLKTRPSPPPLPWKSIFFFSKRSYHIEYPPFPPPSFLESRDFSSQNVHIISSTFRLFLTDNQLWYWSQKMSQMHLTPPRQINLFTENVPMVSSIISTFLAYDQLLFLSKRMLQRLKTPPPPLKVDISLLKTFLSYRDFLTFFDR